MSTVQSIPRPTPRFQAAVGVALAALGVAIALGVGVVILATSTATTHRVSTPTYAGPCSEVCSSGGYGSPARSRSPAGRAVVTQSDAGASRVVVNTETGQAHGAVTPSTASLTAQRYIRAEHSYGAVP